jgi:predicted lipoprotein with Yx(FWY)xxD motif
MRKSGFAAAAGLGSLALLLTACGGSSGASSSPTTTSAAQPGGQATSAALSNMPPPGSTVLHVQKSGIGWVLAVAANGQVVYAYDKDPKGGTPVCTGSCAQTWVPVTGGNPLASPADKGLGTFGTVATPNGAKQITYNGSPLYTYKGAKALTTTGNGVGGAWHVIKMSESNIVGGAG